MSEFSVCFGKVSSFAQNDMGWVVGGILTEGRPFQHPTTQVNCIRARWPAEGIKLQEFNTFVNILRRVGLRARHNVVIGN